MNNNVETSEGLQLAEHRRTAAFLGNYDNLTTEQIANGYVSYSEESLKDHDEINAEFAETARSAYFSALVLRYWHLLWGMQISNTGLCTIMAPIDFVNVLEDGILKALTYHIWTKEFNEDGSINAYYYKTNPKAVDSCINRCIWSSKESIYQHYNMGIRKNTARTTSYEDLKDENGDWIDKTTENVTFGGDEHDGIKAIVATLISKKKYLEALIFDAMAFSDVYKYDEDECATIFDAKKLVKRLVEMKSHENDIVEQLVSRYSISEDTTGLMFDALRDITSGANNTKLYKKIDYTRLLLQKNEFADMLRD